MTEPTAPGGVFDCIPLKARISERQCAINYREAKRRQEVAAWSVGHLVHCLTCGEARDESYIGEERPRDFRRRSADKLVTGVPFTPRPRAPDRDVVRKVMEQNRENSSSKPNYSKNSTSSVGEENAPTEVREKKLMAANVEGVKSGPEHPCPKHPDQEQVICQKPGGWFGKPMGRCLICMRDSAVNAARVRKANRDKGVSRRKDKPVPVVASDRVLVLIFDNCADEDLWADLHEEAKDEFRTPEMQALHLIRVMLRGQEAGG